MGRSAGWICDFFIQAVRVNLEHFAMASTVGADQRKSQRVAFERGIPANMMAIDGTWRRGCIVKDVSDSGARLAVDGSLEGLVLNEFFLLLASRGLAYRRCELAWINGDELGVRFLNRGKQRSAQN